MNSNLRHGFLIVVSFFSLSSLFATHCPKEGTNLPSCNCKRYEGTYGQLFSAAPCIEELYGTLFIIDVSALVWQAIQDGLSFAFKNDPLPINANLNINGNLIGIDFPWEPAVKALIGAEFPKRGWLSQFRWTYFHSHSSKSESQPAFANSSGLLPLWAFPNADIATQFLYGKAQGIWDLTLHAFDIEMGYHPFLSPHFSFQFIAGLKAVSLDQNLKIKYTNGFNDGANQLIDAKASMTNRMTGAGPRIGFHGKFHLPSEFSLITSIDGSLPLWHYRVTREDSDLGSEMGVLERINSTFRERFWTFRSVLETALGLSWDRHPFQVAASYEFQYFAESNMFSMLVNPGNLNLTFHPRGDLFLHGVTLNIHFGY